MSPNRNGKWPGLPAATACGTCERRFDMTTDGSDQATLSADEVSVYVGDQASDAEDGDGYEEQARIRRRRIREQGLEVVRIDDAELDRLRSQVSRIATKLEPSDGIQQDNRGFGVDS